MEKPTSAKQVYMIARPASNIVDLLHDRDIPTATADIYDKVKIALFKQSKSKDKKKAQQAEKDIKALEATKGDKKKEIEKLKEILERDEELKKIMKTDIDTLGEYEKQLETSAQILNIIRLISDRITNKITGKDKEEKQKNRSKVFDELSKISKDIKSKVVKGDGSAIDDWLELEIGDKVNGTELNSKKDVDDSTQHLRNVYKEEIKKLIDKFPELTQKNFEELFTGRIKFFREGVGKTAVASKEMRTTLLTREIEEKEEKLRELKELESREDEIVAKNEEIENLDKELKELERKLDQQLMEELGRDAEQLTDTPFSRINKINAEIRELHEKVPQPPSRAIKFADIKNFETLDQLMTGDNGRIDPMLLIMYASEEYFGHWVGLTIDQGRKRVNYFNSYGSNIDEAIDYIPRHYKVKSGQTYPDLLNLLYEQDKYQVHWNDVQLQSYDPKIQTCGRWTGYFMNRTASNEGEVAPSTLEEFVRTFSKVIPKDRDKVITEITERYIDAGEQGAFTPVDVEFVSAP